MRKEEKYRQENKERLCYCCDIFQPSKKNINKYSVSCRGYGSIFDDCYFTIQLCDKCKQKIKEKWFNENPELVDGYCEEYKYEEDIDKFIHTFPIKNQEYIYNHMDNDTMDRADWIAMKENTLPDFKYRKYGMYSPSEIKVYTKRFPNCEYPIIRRYNDGSQGAWCPFGAHGDIEKNKIIAGINVCDDCFYCKYYKPRESKIKIILNKDFNDYKLYIQSKIKMDVLKNKFE